MPRCRLQSDKETRSSKVIMSGPLEQAGVEDVLSSIRRLVSEDNRKTRPSGGARRAEGLRPRLVLTPALRVPPPVDKDTRAAKPELLDQDAYLENPEGNDVNGADAAQEHSKAVSGSDANVAVDPQGAERTFLGGADTVEHAASLDMFRLNKTIVESDDASDQTPDEDVLPWKNPEATLYGVSENVQDDDTEAENMAEPSQSATGGAAYADEDASVSDTAEVSHLHNASARQRAAAVVRKIAEMEAATAQSAAVPHWEPDASQNGPFASELRSPASTDWDEAETQEAANIADQTGDVEHMDADDIAEHFAADVIDATAEDISADIAASTLDDLDDATLIDEDMLRDMVVEIVRQELQGSLGEKITRNVRKLVRREIQRALAAHDIL